MQARDGSDLPFRVPSMQSIPSADKRVFHSVTTVRGIAALAVCWFHMVAIREMLAPGWLAASADIGWLGPHVFFIVSGFVVPWSLYVVGYRLGDAPRYLARRIVRLDPPYFATILLMLALDALAVQIGLHAQPFLVDWDRLASHLAYLTAILGQAWYQPVYWTLAIEFQFYLLLSLLFPLVASRRRWVRWAVIALGLVAFLPWREVPELGLAPTPELPGSIWVMGYMPLFLLGFVLFQRHAGLIGRRETWLWVAVLVPVAATFTYALALLSLAAFAVMLADSFRSRVTEFLGRISYSLYLVHVPVGVPFQSLVGRLAENDLQRTLVVLGSVALCVLTAWLFYHLVERPSVDLARRIAIRPRQAGHEPDVPPAAAFGVGQARPN